MKQPLLRQLILGALVPLVALPALSFQNLQTAPPRVITVGVERSDITDPARVVGIKFDGRELPAWSDQQIRVDENWLKGMSVIVRNESGKSMVAVMGRVRFHDANTAKPSYFPIYAKTAASSNLIGQIPGHIVRTFGGGMREQPPTPAIAIPPGKDIEVPVASGDEDLRRTIEATMPVSDVANAVFTVTSAYFDDATRWGGFGDYQRLDRTTPGRFNRITFEEFSGGKTQEQIRRETMPHWLDESRAANERFGKDLPWDGPPETTLPQCRKVDTASLSIGEVDGNFAVRDSLGILFECGRDQENVHKMLDIFQHYSIDETCSIESPQTFPFMTTKGQAPSGAMQTEDCLAFDPTTVEIFPDQGRWVLYASSRVTSFRTRAAADHAVEQIRRYGFNQSCYVGRGTYGVPMKCRPVLYFRK